MENKNKTIKNVLHNEKKNTCKCFSNKEHKTFYPKSKQNKNLILK